jgi:acyl carrier protein
MNAERPTQTAARKPRLILWIGWGGVILIGAWIITALAGTVISLAKDGWGSRKLPFLLFIVAFVVIFFCLKAALHPIRGRGDERRAWQERFPTHTDQEFERFLRVVSDSLGIREKHRGRLRPDDRVRALSQEWLCGDGMEIIELFMAIEQEYGLDLPESFHEKDRTLGDLFAYVTQHSSRGGGSSQPERPTQPESG